MQSSHQGLSNHVTLSLLRGPASLFHKPSGNWYQDHFVPLCPMTPMPRSSTHNQRLISFHCQNPSQLSPHLLVHFRAAQFQALLSTRLLVHFRPAQFQVSQSPLTINQSNSDNHLDFPYSSVPLPSNTFTS